MARTLIQIYNEHVKIDKAVTVVYKKVLDIVLKNVIDNMKQQSPIFDELYSRIYYTGSFYDGLKIGSTEQEFDLNIVFGIKRSHLEIVDLGTEPKKPNFGFLRFTKSCPTDAEKSICFERDGGLFLSPEKMFRLIETSGDRALTNLIDGEVFKITRSIGAPYTLKVSGTLENMPIKCDIDFVPSIELDIEVLPRDGQDSIYDRVHKMKETFPCPQKDFMAISLWRADGNKFELDFHNIERGILYNKGCVKTVVKLIKYLRDVKGGSFFKLWSHLLKTVVMHQVIKKQDDTTYWSEKNLEKCFIDSVTALYNGLDVGIIADVFFPSFNMLTRIKRHQVITDTKQWIFKSLRMYKETGDATKMFDGPKTSLYPQLPQNETFPDFESPTDEDDWELIDFEEVYCAAKMASEAETKDGGRCCII